MSTSRLFLYAFVSILFYSARSSEVCDFADVKCWTSGVKYLYSTIVHGVEGLIAPMDPLNIGSFESEIPGVLKVKASNASFYGLTQCSPTLLKFREKEYKYDYILRCPRLYLRAQVAASGYFGPVHINGHDYVTIVAEEYLVKVTGKYEVFNAHDQTSRFYLEEFLMDTEPQGTITLHTENNFGIPENLSSVVESYLKENWRVLEEKLRYPAMYLFMEAIVKEGDIYLRATPRAEIFPKTGHTCTCSARI